MTRPSALERLRQLTLVAGHPLAPDLLSVSSVPPVRDGQDSMCPEGHPSVGFVGSLSYESPGIEPPEDPKRVDGITYNVCKISKCVFKEERKVPLPAPAPPEISGYVREGTDKTDESFLLAAFPGATVSLRPATPVPPPIVMGSWEPVVVPLPPRRKPKRRLPDTAAPPLGPLACIHCGEFCDSRDMSNIRLPEGGWEHLGCYLKGGERRRRKP